MTDKPIIGEFSHPPPHEKTISVTLEWWEIFQCYEITSISNSTWYKPGMRITAEVATKICDLKNWQVTMVKSDLLGKLLGMKNAVGGLMTGGLL